MSCKGSGIGWTCKGINIWCDWYTHLTNAFQYVIQWKYFPLYWSFVRGIYWSPMNSPHKGQWCGALMFSLICAWIKGWVNNCKAGDLRRHRADYDVIVKNAFDSNAWACVLVVVRLVDKLDNGTTPYALWLLLIKQTVFWNWFRLSDTLNVLDYPRPVFCR